MSCNYAVELKNISKVYKMYDRPSQRFLDIISNGKFGKTKKFHALNDFSMQIRKGESVGILGRNGAGKSTLLQILAGIIEPTTGVVETKGNISALLELGAGFNPDFSGRENVILSSAIYGIDLSKNESKLNEIIKFADIGDFIEQPVKIYSSGMYVRLAFAVASQMNPDILIVDEALSVGDLQFQTKCLRLIEKLKSNGCTFIFVSHSPRMVEVFCERAIWLENGLVKMDGEPKKVVRAYENMMVGNLANSKKEKNVINNDSSSSNEYIYFDDSYHIENKEPFSFKAIKVEINTEINPSYISNNDEFNVIINLKINIQDKIVKPLWGIGLFNDLNQPVVHFNTDNCNVDFDGERQHSIGEHNITFVAQLPKLRPGDYLLAIGLDDGVSGNSEVLCHIYDAFKITIASDDVSSQAGYIQLNDCIVRSD